MLYDTHIHTRFSHDSRMNIEDAIQKAQEMGLGITITEHIDLNYPDPAAFRVDIPCYLAAYEQYRSKTVLLGIEVGLGVEIATKNQTLIARHPFDYVLGSIHLVDGIDLYIDAFYRGRDKRQAYDRYLETMLDCLRCHDTIDSLGHIDYICRYAKFHDPELYYSECSDKIDHVLMALADNGKCLELNTRRLNKKSVVENLIPIYRRFYELGGRYITIGSDAHTPKDIGKNFQEAWEIAEICKLRPVWFEQRRMQYVATQ
ncbi:MAG: histidinol phosphate phosphatase [Negativicutes bacterium]|nr:histidinol phosphate phosphatase [Negativicutes bacterium]